MLKKILFFTLSLFAFKSFAATEIVWWHSMGGDNEKEVNEIVKAFNLGQKDYKIKAVFVGGYDDALRKTEEAIKNKSKLPALIQLSEATTVSAIYKYKKVFYPISTMMEDYDAELDEANFIAPVASYYESLDGKLYSFPFNASTPVLWYNKDIFVKAGIKELPKTWQDIELVGERLKENGISCSLTVSYPSWVLLENFSALHNLEFASNQNGYGGLNTELKFNNQKIKNFLEFLVDLKNRGIYQPIQTYEQLLKAFSSGECAMWIGSSSSFNDINSKATFRFGETFIPFDARIVKKPQNSIIGGASLWVVKGKSGSTYKGLVKFIKFLERADLQTIWHTQTGYIPITTAAMIQASNIRLNIVRYGSDTAISQLTLNPPKENSRGIRVGNLLEIRKIAEREIQMAMDGKKSASQALDDAVKQGNQELKKFSESL